ncbi:MAG: hypothetical protein V3T83_18470 [Acidobacteriota bacterium]
MESLPPTQLADPWLLLFGVLVAFLSTVLIAPLPLLDALRSDVSRVLGSRQAARAGAMGRTRAVLVILQIALTGVLLVGAGLFLGSFLSAAGFEKGFEPRGVLVAELPALSNLGFADFRTIWPNFRFSARWQPLPPLPWSCHLLQARAGGGSDGTERQRVP